MPAWMRNAKNQEQVARELAAIREIKSLMPDGWELTVRCEYTVWAHTADETAGVGETCESKVEALERVAERLSYLFTERKSNG